jgi:hypothetical protein
MTTVIKTKRKPTGAAAMGAGPGRPKGLGNKLPTELKEMILQALDEKGGVQYLKQQAGKNPKAFLALLGRVLPLQVAADLNHSGGITVNIKHF